VSEAFGVCFGADLFLQVSHDWFLSVDLGWVRQETEHRPSLTLLPRGKNPVTLTGKFKPAP
jgi:hypothetical protein